MVEPLIPGQLFGRLHLPTIGNHFLYKSFLVLLLLLVPAVASSSCDGSCPVPEHVSGFAVFTSRPEDANAFIQDLRPLIAATRKEPGNVNYAMYTNPISPGVIGFTERYVNQDALQAHLATDHVTSTFSHEYYRTLRSAPPQLFGPWKEVPAEGAVDEEIEMVFYWDMNCTKQHIWDIITKWDDASWVKDVVNTSVVPLRLDGKPMTDEEAREHGPVAIDGGLGNVVQRRTFSNGFALDVRMLERNDTSFVTVQETVTPLVFPGVKFDKFFVTISLHTDGVDADIQTRLRYHVRATLLEGTNEMARQTLKNDFYGPRIDFYQQYFNCSAAVNIKTAKNAISSLHALLTDRDRNTAVPAMFINVDDGLEYLRATFGDDMPSESASVRITTPVKPVVVPDLRAMVVEDIIVQTLGGTVVRPRIVLYQLDPWGRIVSAKIYDNSVAACGDVLPPQKSTSNSWWIRALHAIGTLPLEACRAKCAGKDLIDATNHYYEVLKTRDLSQIRALYTDDPELHDPVGFLPARAFESVYRNFKSIVDKYSYTRYPARTFVHAESRQTVQLVDAVFDCVTGGLGVFTAQPIQLLTFDEKLKIRKFEAFFVPRVLDFAKIESAYNPQIAVPIRPPSKTDSLFSRVFNRLPFQSVLGRLWEPVRFLRVPSF